jgi:predicted metal-binding membrane protein
VASTTARATFAPLPDLRAFVRRGLARRPESWLYGIAAGAGLGLVLPVVVSGGSHAHGHAHGHEHGAQATSVPAAEVWSWLADWRHWILMTLAMMVPVVAPYARRIALRSLWRRRHRAMTGFLLGYLAVWLAIGAVVTGVLVMLDGTRVWPAAPIALLCAAAWQVSRPRRRTLRRCGSLPPAAISGWRADRDSATAGASVGLRCAFVCGPVMLAMAVSQSLLLMGGVLALLLSERARGPNPDRRAGRPFEAWCLVAYAAAFAAVALARAFTSLD